MLESLEDDQELIIQPSYQLHVVPKVEQPAPKVIETK